MSNATALGLDASTQSLTAVLVNRSTGKQIVQHSIAYPSSIWLKAEVPGQVDQSAAGFLVALERLFSELKSKGVDLSTVERIGVSAQQHACVFLGPRAPGLLATLQSDTQAGRSLADKMSGLFSHDRAPIWMTSNTEAEASDLRDAAGGSAAMIRLTGSDSPLRFTGALIRKFAKDHPRKYEETERIALLSQFVPMLLTGSIQVPMDWGNASGTSLMDYRAKVWSPLMIDACSRGLAGGTGALAGKLGNLASPQTIAGTIAGWFCHQFGFSSHCEVLIGSGDNPQTKVLVEDDLLSLGSSFVLMAAQSETALGALDERGWGNGMIDGLGRPFVFGCRTNGALVWDQLRHDANVDFARAESALVSRRPGSILAVRQPLPESFPPSPALAAPPPASGFDDAWAGAVDSALGLIFLGSQPWLAGKTGPLALTGGPTSSPAIVRRVAAFANRPVKVIGTTGAALGAAAGAHACGAAPGMPLPDWLPSTSLVTPSKADVEALHAPGGYLDQLKNHFETTTGIDPTGERS